VGLDHNTIVDETRSTGRTAFSAKAHYYEEILNHLLQYISF
jgi:hypothetical protein